MVFSNRSGEFQVRTRRRLAIIAVISAPTWFLTGCTGSSSGTPSPTTSTTSTATTSSTTGSPEDRAKTQVLAMLPAYFRTINELYNDPNKSANDIYLVATDPEASAELKAINAARVAGIQSSGFSKLVESSVTSVDLTNKPQAQPRVLPTVRATTCVDISDVRAKYKNGESAIPAGRKQFLVSNLTIVNYKYPSTSTWVVSKAPNREADSCSG